METDCRGHLSNTMLFNIKVICKFDEVKCISLLLTLLTVTCEDCDENAQCIAGECTCKENYSGNGTTCESLLRKCYYITCPFFRLFKTIHNIQG